MTHAPGPEGATQTKNEEISLRLVDVASSQSQLHSSSLLISASGRIVPISPLRAFSSGSTSPGEQVTVTRCETS